jgi:uncharacterized protein
VGRDFPQALRGLLRAGAYPHSVKAVKVITTHISWVLLTGDFAYKIKRPVRYPFVDLRAQEQRAFLCREELRLNRRFAPELYLEVCPITLDDGQARVGGPGPVVEHAVKMRQFPQAEQLDRLLEEGRIEPSQLRAFGAELARIHDQLPSACPNQEWGQPAAAGAVIIENLEQCARAADEAWNTDEEVQSLRDPLLALIESSAALLSKRFADGLVRECHGDLHTSNLVRTERGLVAFDCLDFDPSLRWIDVADEVAFLLADLAASHADRHAHAFLGGYLDQSGDFQACRVLSLYKAHRALVRAKVLSLNAAEAGGVGDSQRLLCRRRYLSHLACARAALGKQRPKLILMAGISGTGKTWLAERISPSLGAVHLRSDIERKRLAGLGELDRSHCALGGGIYDPKMNEIVYEHLAGCALAALEGGFTTILDATFQRRSDRAKLSAMAEELGVRTHLVLCHASQATLESRISARERRGEDPSEADLSVMRAQHALFEPIAEGEQLSVIDASTEAPGIAEWIALELKSSH